MVALYFKVAVTINILLLIYRQLFLSHPFGAQKGAKGTAQTKCSRNALLLTNFRWAKISLGWALLAGNFPLIVAGCASLATLTARQKTYASFPRLSAAVACDFDNAVFFLK